MATTQILCTGDLHLGRYPSRVPARDRTLSVEHLWQDLVGYVVQQDINAVALTGDLVEALRHVTKQDGESYREFAERSGQHPIARQVKIAYLEDNMDVTRLDAVTDEDAERLAKYRRAHRRLTEGGES